MHLGPNSIPHEESDARVNFEPNFYYAQEDSLIAFCAAHKTHWNTTRPSFILGAVPDAAMNLVFPLAVYATVQKHLGGTLDFPSDMAAWSMPKDMSSAMTNAYFSEWAVLTNAARDQSFNETDNCAFAWEKFWPKFADWFGLKWNGPETEDENAFMEIKSQYVPTPRGYGPPATFRVKFTLAGWAKSDEVKAAWRELTQKHDLSPKELGSDEEIDRIFSFADGALLSSQPGQYRYVLKNSDECPESDRADLCDAV